MSDVSVKITELPRAKNIGEKDLLPFATNLLTGTESTQAIPLSVLRTFLQNPTVYASASVAVGNTKSGDYVLVYADSSKLGANLYYNDGTNFSIVTDQNGNNIVLSIPKNFSGREFDYSTSAGETLLLPEWLIGTQGYRKILIHSTDSNGYYGEYELAKMTPTDSFTMSQNAVMTENYQGAFTFTWGPLSSIGITFKFSGSYNIRIY